MIEVQDLRKSFTIRGVPLHAVNGVSFRRGRRRDHRAAGSERRGQDHDAAHALHADAAGPRGGCSSTARCCVGPGRRTRAARRAAGRTRPVQAPDAPARTSSTSRGFHAIPERGDRGAHRASSRARSTCGDFLERRTEGFSHGQRTQDRNRARACPRSAQRAARRADQRSRRHDDACAPRLPARAARRGPLRAAVEPRHAGGRGGSATASS